MKVSKRINRAWNPYFLSLFDMEQITPPFSSSPSTFSTPAASLRMKEKTVTLQSLLKAPQLRKK